jgi:hypothetical protein
MILTPIGKGGGGGPLYPDFVGKRAIFVGSGLGPATASSTVGDPVSLDLPNYYIDSILSGASTDGTYLIEGVPNSVGPRATWSLFYYAVSAPTAPYAGTALATKTFVISAFVGQY